MVIIAVIFVVPAANFFSREYSVADFPGKSNFKAIIIPASFEFFLVLQHIAMLLEYL